MQELAMIILKEWIFNQELKHFRKTFDLERSGFLERDEFTNQLIRSKTIGVVEQTLLLSRFMVHSRNNWNFEY